MIFCPHLKQKPYKAYGRQHGMYVTIGYFPTKGEAAAAYNSAAGALILAIGGAVSFAAYRVMLRIGRLPQERRVLR